MRNAFNFSIINNKKGTKFDKKLLQNDKTSIKIKFTINT